MRCPTIPTPGNLRHATFPLFVSPPVSAAPSLSVSASFNSRLSIVRVFTLHLSLSPSPSHSCPLSLSRLLAAQAKPGFHSYPAVITFRVALSIPSHYPSVPLPLLWCVSTSPAIPHHYQHHLIPASFSLLHRTSQSVPENTRLESSAFHPPSSTQPRDPPLPTLCATRSTPALARVALSEPRHAV